MVLDTATIGLIVAVAAVLIAAIPLWVYSEPDADVVTEAEIDYFTGSQVVIKHVTVKLGRIPLLSRRRFRRVFLTTFDEADMDAEVSLHSDSGSSIIPREEGWFIEGRHKNDKRNVYIRRTAIPSKGRQFNLTAKYSQRLSRDVIRDMVVRGGPTETRQVRDTKISWVLENISGMMIRKYEFLVPFPRGAVLKSVSIRDVASGQTPSDFKTSDFLVRFDEPFSGTQTPRTTSLAELQSSLVVTLALTKGKTEVSYEYTIPEPPAQPQPGTT